MTRRRGGHLETAALAVLGARLAAARHRVAVGAGWRWPRSVWSVREKLVGLLGMFLIALVGWGVAIAVQTHSSVVADRCSSR